MTIKVFKSLRHRYLWLWPCRARLEIDFDLWQETVEELGRRSLDGKRESGAFLLASASERVAPLVVESAFYDDLDPDCLVGNIHIKSTGFSKLWDLCDAKSLRVVADVHTHPGSSVTQSSIDRSNPMVAREGHIALIVPHYGTRPVEVKDVGVHEYRGDRGWKSWLGSRAERVFRLRNS